LLGVLRIRVIARDPKCKAKNAFLAPTDHLREWCVVLTVRMAHRGNVGF
jgi:hypothetical protein